MNEITIEQSPAPANVVVLRGPVRGALARRELPSGAVVVQFDVATHIVDGARSHSASVPVAWTDPSAAALRSVTEGSDVVVIGTIRRRFFRVGGATQSRTEVVADAVLPASRRTHVAKALGSLADRLVR